MVVFNTSVRVLLDSQVLSNAPQLVWFAGAAGALHKVHQKNQYPLFYRVVQPRAMEIALCLLNNGDKAHLPLMSD